MSMFFARCAAQGQVHAFETSPNNAGVALKNLQINGIGNVVFNNMCVGNRSGEAIVSDDSGGVASLLPSSARNRQTIAVPMVSADGYSRTHGEYPTLVKIDVEGFEVEVLTGMKEILSRRPKLHLELHTFKFADRVGYVRSCLELADLSDYAIVAQTFPGAEMVSLERIDENAIAFLAGGDNPHLYCLPRRTATAAAN
jgi:FkbM family methyltransferase